MTSWPGKLVNISVGIFDETNQSASEFLQLEPANNIEVSNNALKVICNGKMTSPEIIAYR